MAGDPKGRTRNCGARAADARAERLAAALRANLLRRKTQAKEQAKARADATGSDGVEPPETPADPQTHD